MCIGWDSGDAVSDLYKAPGRFKGGTIQVVGVDTGKESYEDLALEAKRLLMKH
jgi:arylsulfatase